MSEKVQGVIQLALVSMQPSSAEELPVSAVRSGGVENESAIVDGFFAFCLHDLRTGSKVFITILSIE